MPHHCTCVSNHLQIQIEIQEQGNVSARKIIIFSGRTEASCDREESVNISPAVRKNTHHTATFSSPERLILQQTQT